MEKDKLKKEENAHREEVLPAVSPLPRNRKKFRASIYVSDKDR